MKLDNTLNNKINYNKLNLLSIKSHLRISDKSFFKINSYKNLELNLKKILKIVFEYHKSNKTIIFIGFPFSSNYNFMTLFNKYNYIFLDKNTWVNGTLCNSPALVSHIKSKKIYRRLRKNNLVFLSQFNSLVKLKKKPDLIILFDDIHAEKLISECKKVKIPVISFLSSAQQKQKSTLFHVFLLEKNNYPKQLIHKYIYFLLSSILSRYFKKSIIGS